MSTDATIAERLAAVRERLAEAARASGREPAAVRLVAVTKTMELAAAQEALAAGQCDFGENYLQHALPKIEALAGRGARWHMIGKLQSNKAAKVARSFDLIHGLESLSAAQAIARAMTADGRVARVLLQIKLGGGDERAGVEPDEAAAFAEKVVALSGIELHGVMGVAPVGEEPRPHFARLRCEAEALRALGLPNAPLTEISAGMSQDFADAVREGATLVRIGTAIFGPRRKA